ncbi:hypothetical protein CASFOL_014632 [Castilleja foliolosa]|uniref:Uncharacterized protein n=1 Tax=Castilleja foliolosa TaxID=1961234 RepID=A0ABD3DES6_9LAMI
MGCITIRIRKVFESRFVISYSNIGMVLNCPNTVRFPCAVHQSVDDRFGC